MKDLFFKQLKEMKIPRKPRYVWFLDNFDIDEFRETRTFRKNEPQKIDSIFNELKSLGYVDPETAKDLFSKWIDENVDENSFIGLSNQTENTLVVSRILCKILETDNEVVDKLREWLQEFINEELEYEKYLELKERFEK